MATPGLGLDAEVAQLGGVVGVQHRSVGTRAAQRRVGFEERLVAALEQIHFRVVQMRVAVGVRLPVLVP